MIIRKANEEKELRVHGIYWAKYRGSLERLYLVIPEADYPGFIAVVSEEYDILDPSIDGFVLSKDLSGNDLVVDRRLSDPKFLARIIDHDPEAMREYEAMQSDE